MLIWTIAGVLVALGAGVWLGRMLGRASAERAFAQRSLETEKALSALQAQLEAERHAGEEKLAQWQQAEAKFREAFQALSAEALKSNNEAFLQIATTRFATLQQGAQGDLDARKQAIEQLLLPVGTTLLEMKESLGKLEKDRVDAYSQLREQIVTISRTESQLKEETTRLVQALKSSTVRGRWGELQLRRVVEMAGMLEHADFTEQTSVQAEDGRLRPDLVVRTPGGRQIVVDAKTPLDDYLRALEAPDDATRDLCLAQHARKVRDHMQRLSEKRYWEQFEHAPDLVVMFLPGEMFFSAALQQDPALIEYGVDRKVIPASPTTLIGLLRAVAYGWQQEKLAENAQHISELGKELYERVVTMGDHFAKVGKGLDNAVKSYNEAVGSLETRVLPKAREFRELGVGSGKELVALDPVERTCRKLQAPELVSDPEDFGASSGLFGPTN